MRRRQIALQYARLKRDTSRYQEERRQNLNIQQRRPLKAAKIPRQMPLFIKTISAAQITDNPGNITETTTAQRK